MNIDTIAFLSLIIALSAYVATIRLRLIDKMSSDTGNKSKYICMARVLTLSDAPLVISGIFLFIYGFWSFFSCSSPPEWVKNWSVYLFTFALFTLSLHHAWAWKRSWFGK